MQKWFLDLQQVIGNEIQKSISKLSKTSKYVGVSFTKDTQNFWELQNRADKN